MTRDDRIRQQRHSDDDAPTPMDKSRGDTKSQGIVRDERGQEQPADKERAQRTSKSE